MQEIVCPVCNADLPLTGDEDQGDSVFCPFCNSPLKITSIDDDGDVTLEEDF